MKKIILLFLSFLFLGASTYFLWKALQPKPILYPINIQTRTHASGLKTINIQAIQKNQTASINIKAGPTISRGILNLKTGIWLIKAVGYDHNQKIKAKSSVEYFVTSKNPTIKIHLNGFSEQNFLSVSGQHIINKQGNRVELKGYGLTNAVYNLEDPKELKTTQYNLTEQDYQTIKESGANSVRFYIQYHWLDPKYQNAFFAYLDDQIAFASKNKLYIILNLHFFGMAWDVDNKKADGFYKGGKYYAGKYDLNNFWKTISDRYKYEPTIAGYDLINEPNCHQDFSESKLYSIYNNIIDILRKNNDTHIVFIADPVGKFNNQNAVYHDIAEPFQKLTDNNIIYEYHWYLPIEFTHQGTFYSNYFELGASYPFNKIHNQYKGGFYNYPYWSETQAPMGKWKKYTGPWVDLINKSNTTVDIKENMFNMSLSAGKLTGKVWFDGIVLEKKNIKTGKITQLEVPNSTFNSFRDYEGWNPTPNISAAPARWYPLNNPETTGIKFVWDKKTNYIGKNSGSLLIDGTKAKWAGSNQWCTWGQSGGALSTFYDLELGYVYRASSWVKIEDNPGYNISLSFSIHNTKKELQDKTFLKKAINNYYEKWAENNNVPLYCGEFGTTHPAMLPFNIYKDSSMQQAWVKDMVEILNQNTKNWAYHSFRSYAQRGDLFGLFDKGKHDLILQEALKTGF